MKLYHNPISPNARRVLFTAAQLGIPLEEQVLDIAKGEHKSPEYLAINANGMIPTLVDGNLKLGESRAIMQYLAAKKPEGGLLPDDEQGRADVLRWQFWDAAHFAPAVGTMLFELLIKKMLGLGEPDMNAVDKAREQFKRFAGVLNTGLAGRHYLVGDRLSLADITVACTLTYAEPLQLHLGDYPNAAAWLKRISALDAWKKTQP